MKVLEGRNVNHLLPQGIALLKEQGKKISPRGMVTIEHPSPVTSVYQKPCERVLFDPVRDANPFFHFMEGLWIIGGRNDVEFLVNYNSNMRNYSDDGVTFHGAYGHRLRHKNQVERACKLFIQDPNTRQVVLQIWDAERDLGAKSKDIPCNDLIILKIRNNKLNMTVCNRSNDIVWGCYGANAVHFSMLQEYMAGVIGCEVGVYNQMSDSFHVYEDNPYWMNDQHTRSIDPYVFPEFNPYPMCVSQEWGRDLNNFFNGSTNNFLTTFFYDVVSPMADAWKEHKENNSGADHAVGIEADDWRLACLLWLERRGDTVDRKLWGFSETILNLF